MLPPSTWKLQAIVRLLASIFVCICLGSILTAALAFFAGSPTAVARARFLFASGGSMVLLLVALWVLGKEWTLENVLKRMIWFLTSFYAGVLLWMWVGKLAGHPEPTVSQMVLGTLSFQGAALPLIWRFLREHQFTAASAFGFSEDTRRAVLLGIATALLFFPVGRTLWWASSELMPYVPVLKLQPQEQQVVQTLRAASSWAPRFCLGAVAILLAPVAEEILFRGILYQAIKRAGYFQLALWGTSVAFAAMHLTLVAFLPLLALALLLTALYEFTGNLLAPIVAHALFNALNFALVYVQPAP